MAKRRDKPKRSEAPSPPPEAGRPGDRAYWLAAGLLAALLGAQLAQDIARPFYGLHAWNDAANAWRARALLRYPLSYTRGLAVWAVGDPPAAKPNRSMDHPQLGHWVKAAELAMLGDNERSPRIFRLVWSVVSLLLLMQLLRHLVEDREAVLAGAVYVLLPVVDYFGTGALNLVLQLVATWCYLALIGGLRAGPPPGRRHWLGLGLSLLFCVQLSWHGAFCPLAIAVHYAGRCIFRRRRPDWRLAAVLAGAPLVSAIAVFGLMAAFIEGGVDKIVDLFIWRAGRGEMKDISESFLWGEWFNCLWKYGVSNFTWPVLVAAGAGAVLGPLAAVARRLGRDRPAWGLPKAHLPALGAPWPYPPYLGLLLLPGVLQIAILRGAVWRHQHWEGPLGPGLAILAAAAIVMLADFIGRRSGAIPAAAACLAFAVIAPFCLKGTYDYQYIRWHSPRKIEMFKELNRLIPPDKALLSAEDFLVNQHAVKGAHYRPEIAYYLDREVVQPPRLVEFQQKLSGVRFASQEQAQAWFAREFPPVIEDVLRQAGTGRYPVFLMPAYPVLGPLANELARRYRLYDRIPGQEAEWATRTAFGLSFGQRSPRSAEEAKDIEVVRFAMPTYLIFDLRQPATAPAR